MFGASDAMKKENEEFRKLAPGVLSMHVERNRSFGSVSGVGGHGIYEVTLILQEDAWKRVHAAIQDPSWKPAGHVPDVPQILPGDTFRIINLPDDKEEDL